MGTDKAVFVQVVRVCGAIGSHVTGGGPVRKYAEYQP